jgi:hypothetical protein
MDALVSAVLIGIFHLFPVPVPDLPVKSEYLPNHSLSIRSETTLYRLTGSGEMEKSFTRNFLDTSRREERERAVYHLDSVGNVIAWEEYGNDSLLRTRGATVYSDGRLQSASHADTAGRVFRSETYTWSGGELQTMDIVITDAETTSTVFEYDQGRIVKYYSPSDGPGSYTAIAYLSPDTIRGEEYRDSLLAFATELIFANGKLVKVRYPGAAAIYTYGDNDAIRPRNWKRLPAGLSGQWYDALGRRPAANRIGYPSPSFPGNPRSE